MPGKDDCHDAIPLPVSTQALEAQRYENKGRVQDGIYVSNPFVIVPKIQYITQALLVSLV